MMTLSQSNRLMFRKVMMSLGREASLLSIIMIIVMAAPLVKSVESVTEPNVEFTSVYWGTNPLGGVSVRPGDTNVPLSIVLSNAGTGKVRVQNLEGSALLCVRDSEEGAPEAQLITVSTEVAAS